MTDKPRLTNGRVVALVLDDGTTETRVVLDGALVPVLVYLEARRDRPGLPLAE